MTSEVIKGKEEKARNSSRRNDGEKYFGEKESNRESERYKEKEEKKESERDNDRERERERECVWESEGERERERERDIEIEKRENLVWGPLNHLPTVAADSWCGSQ